MVSMIKGRDSGKIGRRFGWRQGWTPVNSFLNSFKFYVFMHMYALYMVLLNLKNQSFIRVSSWWSTRLKWHASAVAVLGLGLSLSINLVSTLNSAWVLWSWPVQKLGSVHLLDAGIVQPLESLCGSYFMTGYCGILVNTCVFFFFLIHFVDPILRFIKAYKKFGLPLER